MLRSLKLAGALALAARAFVMPASAGVPDRALPMAFELRLQGPANICGKDCKTLISATGSITADTPRSFLEFAQQHDLAKATLALDSDGGSVLGAIALGREIRRLALATTVGRTIDIDTAKRGVARAVLSPHAECESMCAFVLLGGVQRSVPPEARVRVHQIWLGDRREDPTAANYSAEDLVLVQRDIGRVAQYTAEMGASIELLDLALRIPPWEPMHAMTRDELRSTRLLTDETGAPLAATVAASPPSDAPPAAPIVDLARATPISERRWAMVDHAGVASLARRHLLTVEGDEIGNFDLLVACGEGRKSYDVSYVEHRHNADLMPLPSTLTAVTLRIGAASAPLKVTSSRRQEASSKREEVSSKREAAAQRGQQDEQDELVTYATGTVPAAQIGGFASAGNHSMVIETESDGMVTVIRLGNTGAQQNLPRLAASCGKAGNERADLSAKKTGGYAAAQ